MSVCPLAMHTRLLAVCHWWTLRVPCRESLEVEQGRVSVIYFWKEEKKFVLLGSVLQCSGCVALIS